MPNCKILRMGGLAKYALSPMGYQVFYQILVFNSFSCLINRLRLKQGALNVLLIQTHILNESIKNVHR